MRFINREKELGLLAETGQLSQRKLYSIAIYGLRRVGKTRLVLEHIKKKPFFFFVNKNKSRERLLKEYENELKKEGLLTPYESLPDFDAFFKILFEKHSGTVIFDEFQNFIYVDKAVFGILQRNIDHYEDRKNLLLIFTGSTIGMLKKLFRDKKEPLYDRIKRELYLKPLLFPETIQFGKELNIDSFEEIVRLYSVFGGFPKYYVSLEDEFTGSFTFKEVLEKFFLNEGALLEDEVEKILSLEFGKRYGLYYNILEAVANGENTISKIASYLRKKESSIARQVNELVNYFEILKMEYPLLGKRGIFCINHPLINFWFRFFYKENSLYKRRDADFLAGVRNQIESYIGTKFELVCREFLSKDSRFNFDLLSRQWGKIPQAEKGRNTYEIDICGLNEKEKKVLFGECKWKEGVKAISVLSELKEKAKYVSWHNEERKEYFAIFAKSFKDREKVKKELRKEGVLLFDLNDMEKVF